MRSPRDSHGSPRPRRWYARLGGLIIAATLVTTPAAAQDDIYFPAVTDVTAKLVQKINAETVRIDMSVSLLTERAISTALVARFKSGVGVRLIADRYSLFDVDSSRRAEIYYLASEGVPIRVRNHPTYYPELAAWKATIFAGQNLVSFGSANYTPLELAPDGTGAYTDQTVIFTTDPELVAAFKSQFDRMWNDTDREVESIVGRPPYFSNWDAACADIADCASEYRARYPSPKPMHVDTRRLEPDAPTPADLLWGQGRAFNSRLAAEIAAETQFVDIVVHRLTVDDVTQALLDKHAAGVPVRVIIEPDEYRNRRFPEFWINAANIDRLWKAGIPIRQRAHPGFTHMKMLVTSSYATNASSNFSAAWQRDHNYFVSASAKPAIYAAMKNRFQTMWNSSSAFSAFSPLAPDTPAQQEPAHAQTDASTNTVLAWARTPFATSYDVYLGESSSSMTKAGTVTAKLTNDPPRTYYWSLSGLKPFTTYYWKIVARTLAPRDASSSTRSFTTGAAAAISVSPTTLDLTAAGRTGSITVTAAGGATWTAASSDTSWLTVSPGSGSGSRSVSYIATYNNTASPRTATITIGGVAIAVNQDVDLVPGPPRNVSAATSPGVVQFSWLPPNTGGTATKYQVDFADNAAFANARYVQTDSAPSHRLSQLAAGRYFARVSAMNGVGISTPSATIEFIVPAASSGGGGGGGGGGGSAASTPAPSGPTGPVISPEAPRNFRATIAGQRVTLLWDLPTAGDTPISYVIEVGLGPTRADYVFPTNSALRSAVFDGVPLGVYYARLRAVRASGIGPASAEIEIAVGNRPAAPSGLTATVVGSQVTLRWTAGGGATASTAATHYVLEAGFTPGASNAASMPVGLQTAISVSAVPSGVYYVRVRAANGSAMSAASNEVVVVVP